MAEAYTGHCWLKEVPKPSVQVTDLPKAFMDVTGMQHPVVCVTCCWGDPPSQVPYQNDGGEYTRVMMLVNTLACRLPSENAFDELVYPPKALQHKGEVSNCLLADH